VKRETRDARR